jgi:hypothetical protein
MTKHTSQRSTSFSDVWLWLKTSAILRNLFLICIGILILQSGNSAEAVVVSNERLGDDESDNNVLDLHHQSESVNLGNPWMPSSSCFWGNEVAPSRDFSFIAYYSKQIRTPRKKYQVSQEREKAIKRMASNQVIQNDLKQLLATSPQADKIFNLLAQAKTQLGTTVCFEYGTEEDAPADSENTRTLQSTLNIFGCKKITITIYPASSEESLREEMLQALLHEMKHAATAISNLAFIVKHGGGLPHLSGEMDSTNACLISHPVTAKPSQNWYVIPRKISEYTEELNKRLSNIVKRINEKAFTKNDKEIFQHFHAQRKQKHYAPHFGSCVSSENLGQESVDRDRRERIASLQSQAYPVFGDKIKVQPLTLTLSGKVCLFAYGRNQASSFAIAAHHYLHLTDVRYKDQLFSEFIPHVVHVFGETMQLIYPELHGFISELQTLGEENLAQLKS